MDSPETRYAVRPDGVNIAYQGLGEGPLNLVWCQGFISHLDLQWSNPASTRFFQRLASFSRLLLAPGLLRAVGRRSMREAPEAGRDGIVPRP